VIAPKPIWALVPVDGPLRTMLGLRGAAREVERMWLGPCLGRPDLWNGGAMEPYNRNPMSPAGQVDAAGDLALGWKTNRSGRRRATRMILGLLAVIALGVALIWLLA